MLDLFPPTDQQLAVINHRGRNLLVLAGPGTGKTETLARRFAALVAEGIPPHQILVLTFSRRAAEEMRDRILLRLRQVTGRALAVCELYIKTFHSFCSRLLAADEARIRKRALLTPVRERLLWRRLMQSPDLRLESFDVSVKGSSQFATDCLNVIAQLKGRGITSARLSGIAERDLRLCDIAALYVGIERERERLGLHDFRDLVNEAVAELQNPRSDAIGWLQAAAFRHVLVDEFQDSDPMQLRLLEAVRSALEPKPSFCFVGDKNQSIYRFRGGSPANIDLASQSFQCDRLHLHNNRRSAPVILHAANADMLLDRHSKTTAANPDMRGLVRLLRPRTIEEEIRLICDAVVAKIDDGMPARSIAVLLRQTRPYQELLRSELKALNIPVAAAPTAGFYEDSLIDAVLSAVRTLATPGDRDLWRRLLCNPVVGFVPIDVQYALDAGRRNGMADLRMMLRANPPVGKQPIHHFLDAWERCREAFQKQTPGELANTIVRELDLLRPVREPEPTDGLDAATSPQRLEALIQAAEDYADESSELRASASVSDFVSNLDETIGLLADTNQPPPASTDGVRVISIHAAKGLEFDFVVIPQLLDGVLPASVRPNRLLSGASVRRLREAGADIFVDDDEARVEEHSLWYVALTRARCEILATAPQVDDDGVEVVASPFARAIELVEANPEGPLLAAAGPDLRPEVPAKALAIAGQPVIAPGIRLPIETLSPTSIGTFLTCPRRFYYGDILRLPQSDDDATAYGRKLHDILRRFHEVETDFENVNDDAEALARFERAFNRLIGEAREPGASGSSPLARFEREDLQLRLAQYARELVKEAHEEPFRVLACEVPVLSSLGGVTIRGYVDRVDRLRGGELAIRDYKSGRLYCWLVSGVRQLFERIDAGETIFGDVPKGLNLQTVLYLPTVEEKFEARVRRLDYIYFRGAKSADRNDLLVERTLIVEDASSNDPFGLRRSEIARVRRDVAARIVELCASGSLTQFPTTSDEQACMFCDFVRVCPGFGTIPA